MDAGVGPLQVSSRSTCASVGAIYGSFLPANGTPPDHFLVNGELIARTYSHVYLTAAGNCQLSVGVDPIVFTGNFTSLQVGTGSPTNVLTVSKSGVPDSTWSTVGPLFNITNTSSNAGYGQRENYYSYATNTGFELANANLMIARSTSTNHTVFMSNWWVDVSPQDTSSYWAAVATEINPVNRGNDLGWGPTRGQFPQLTGGIQVVPESQTFGEPGTGQNILFSYATAESSGTNTFGNHAKTYNGLLIEQNSIAPTGRGLFVAGDTTGVSANYPLMGLQIYNTWGTGIDTTGAAFTNNIAARFSVGQKLSLNGDDSITIYGDSNSGDIDTSANINIGGELKLNGLLGISFPPSDSTPGGSIAIGSGALNNQPSLAAYGNTSIGYRTLSASMTTAAVQQTAVGYQALGAVTSGNNNTGVGFQAGYGITSGSSNVAVGNKSIYNGSLTGSYNVGVGQYALPIITGSAQQNVGIGYLAGRFISTGGGNIAIGANSLNATSGNNLSGNNNVVIGTNAGNLIQGSSSQNTIVGYNVGSANLQGGSFNILIGTGAGVDTPATNTTNYLNIGNVIFGTGIGTEGSGNVGVGTHTPQATLDINGYMRLAKNSAQPASCSSTNDGAIALTHVYTACVCKGGTSAWVSINDGVTACSF